MNAEASQRRELSHLIRALDDTHARFAGEEVEARIEALAGALRQALAAEPADGQAALVEELARRFEPEPAVRGPAPATSGELEDLRREVEQLRAQLASRPAASPAPALGVVRALFGDDANSSTRVDAERVAAAVAALVGLATYLVKAFLSTSDKKGDSVIQVDRFRSVLRGELQGTLPQGSTEKLLEEVKGRIGAQVQAFVLACSKGARNLLKELDPAFLEDVSKESAGALFGMFRHQKMWEVFERRHREMSDSEDLYDTYFDGAFRAALVELRERK